MGKHEENKRSPAEQRAQQMLVFSGDQNTTAPPTSSDSELEEGRPAWSNKLEYILAQVGFSVGLGNVWRFPYMCHKNGGGAYLVPYIILLFLIGIPLFYLELAVGQKIRRGSMGVWNYIHPKLGGIGVSSLVVCGFVGLYYNAIIGWSIFYFGSSFQYPLPWVECPTNGSGQGTVVEPECERSSATTYFWYREALDIATSIEDSGDLNWKMTLSLLAAWILVSLAVIKGIQSSGKVMYFSSLFPYVVLFCFLVRGLSLKGAADGITYMFTPKLEKMLDLQVWREAATQVFFALGLGFGGVIAFSSYNKKDNNCQQDALLVPVINFLTSILATLVVFAVLGFKANVLNEKCVTENTVKMMSLFNTSQLNENIIPAHINISSDLSAANYALMYSIIKAAEGNNFPQLGLNACVLEEELNKAVQGTGLAFIAFTEAMTHFPASPLWSVMFFLMLINLGLGSMIGIVTGMTTPILDAFKIRKEILCVVVCVTCFLLGLVFVQPAGNYFVTMFDDYSAGLPLTVIALLENLSVAWIYGGKRFMRDLEDMLGFKPYGFLYYMWCYVTPAILTILTVATVVQMARTPAGYSAWVASEAVERFQSYPPWALAMACLLIIVAFLPLPIVFIVRHFDLTSKISGNLVVLHQRSSRF